MNELYVLTVQRDECRQHDIMAQPKHYLLTWHMLMLYMLCVLSLYDIPKLAFKTCVT